MKYLLASLEPQLVHSLPTLGPDHLVINARVPNAEAVDGFHQFLLDQIDSVWPPGWQSITDQYCSEELKRFRSITVVLNISDDSDALALALTTQCFAAASVFHGPIFVRLIFHGDL